MHKTVQSFHQGERCKTLALMPRHILLTEVVDVSELENTREATSALEPSTVQVDQLPKVPPPTATGDDRVTILKHELTLTDPSEEFPTPAGVELAIRNISGQEIATAIFEATFYDQAGQVVSTVKHNEIEFKPDTSRAIRITSTVPHYESYKVKSYAVRLVWTTTTDEESIQLRRHELNTTADGEEHVWGIAKNIGSVKTDAAVVWTFYDPQKQDLGTRVVILRDIEPKTIRQYAFTFKPPKGNTVRTYTVTVGRIEEERANVSSPVHASQHCCS